MRSSRGARLLLLGSLSGLSACASLPAEGVGASAPGRATKNFPVSFSGKTLAEQTEEDKREREQKAAELKARREREAAELKIRQEQEAAARAKLEQEAEEKKAAAAERAAAAVARAAAVTAVASVPASPQSDTAKTPVPVASVESNSCANAEPLREAPRTLDFSVSSDLPGPSYPDTLTWIAKTLGALDTRLSVDTVETQYLSGIFGFEECSVQLRSGVVVKGVAQCEMVSVKYAEIDPAGVRVAKSGELFTVNDSVGHVIWFKERELAKRVAKAWSRAAELCGGRVEPF